MATKTKTAPKTSTPDRTVAILRKNINVSDSIQARVSMDKVAAAEYGESLKAKEAVPAIVVFTCSKTDDDDTVYFMGDGFHRNLGAELQGLPAIMADVYVAKDPKTAAELYALGANAKHGVRRTQADRRKAIRLALSLRPKHSDNAIGKLTNTDGKTVATVRAQMAQEGNAQVNGTARVTSRGTTMETAAVGTTRKPAQDAAAALGEGTEGTPADQPATQGNGRVLGGGLVTPPVPVAPAKLSKPRKSALASVVEPAFALLKALEALEYPLETRDLELATKALLQRLDRLSPQSKPIQSADKVM